MRIFWFPYNKQRNQKVRIRPDLSVEMIHSKEEKKKIKKENKKAITTFEQY